MDSYGHCLGIYCLLLQIVLHIVFTAEVCPPKLLPGGTVLPIFAIGDVAELKCDVSARNASTDTLHWKRGNEVMSQDKKVVPKYEKKFNVSLEGDVYSLRFIVEENDSGKYNCTCLSGGLQYHLYVKKPCNKCEYVQSDSSLDIVRTCKKGAILTVKEKWQRHSFGVALDCGCTYPAAGRQFLWRWKYQQTKYSPLTLAPKLGKTITLVSPRRKPSGCYTGQDGMTYRYSNITTIYNDTFQCRGGDMPDGLYSLYVDDETGTGEEPIYKACCQDGDPTCPISPLFICFIVATILDVICIVIVIYAIYTWRRQVTEKVPIDPWRGFIYILAAVGIVQLIVLLVLIGVTVSQAQKGYMTYIMRNCVSIKCGDGLDAGMIIGAIVLVIISSLIILLVIWQIYYRTKGHKDYRVERGSTGDSNIGLTPTEQEMSERNESRMSVNSGTTNTTERTEFGLKEFGGQEPSMTNIDRKKESISEDEGVHVGDMASVSHLDPPVPV